MFEDRNKEGEIVFYVVVEGGYFDIVKMCLEKGVKVRLRRVNFVYLLYIVVINGYVEIVKLLVDVRVKIEVRNVNYEIFFYKVVVFNKFRMVEFFFEK